MCDKTTVLIGLWCVCCEILSMHTSSDHYNISVISQDYIQGDGELSTFLALYAWAYNASLY